MRKGGGRGLPREIDLGKKRDNKWLVVGGLWLITRKIILPATFR